nr:DUF302 domain-containing protein [Gammaproteobacteria bacterium]
MKRLGLLLIAMMIGTAVHAGSNSMNIEDTVVKMKIADDITMDDAVSSMKLRANLRNMKLVAELPLSKQIESMGKEARRMEIFQFCDPLTAQRMVEANINFAAYLPCRIALVEDQDGKGWLVMMNLDIMIKGATLSPELKSKAIEVRDALNDIIQAGANGDL